MDPPKSAEALLREGDFDLAEAAFHRRLEQDEGDAKALLGLSAICRRTGRRKQARRLLVSAARARPVEKDGKADPRGLILRPRCIDAANYCAVRRATGVFQTKYKGGHFSLSNLLPAPTRKHLVTANLVSGDAGPLHAAGDVRLLLNTVACADRSRASLQAIAGYLRDNPALPVINRPEAVARTTRDGNYARMADIEGAVFPKTLRISLREPEEALLQTLARSGMALPLIIRATGRQTGRQLHFCETREEVQAAFRALARHREAYVIAFADCRRGDGFFRKARAFFIDGKVYPVAWLASDTWQIHSGDRYRVMASDGGRQAEERAYLADPEAACGASAWNALHEVKDRLGLDFAGIDFAILPGGKLFIFESNAAMRHNFDHVPSFPYTRRYLETVSAAFDRMVTERLQYTQSSPCSDGLNGAIPAPESHDLAAPASAISFAPSA